MTADEYRASFCVDENLPDLYSDGGYTTLFINF